MSKTHMYRKTKLQNVRFELKSLLVLRLTATPRPASTHCKATNGIRISGVIPIKTVCFAPSEILTDTKRHRDYFPDSTAPDLGQAESTKAAVGTNSDRQVESSTAA